MSVQWNGIFLSLRACLKQATVQSEMVVVGRGVGYKSIGLAAAGWAPGGWPFGHAVSGRIAITWSTVGKTATPA